MGKIKEEKKGEKESFMVGIELFTACGFNPFFLFFSNADDSNINCNLNGNNNSNDNADNNDYRTCNNIDNGSQHTYDRW